MEYRQLTDNEKREVCAWRYARAYARYNLPPFDSRVKGSPTGWKPALR